MDILTRLREGAVLVADGAMGTFLQAAGLPAGLPGEAWVLERPEAVADVHRLYLEAGAELILTCTFGGTRARLERVGLGEHVAEVNRRAAQVARQAAGNRAFIAGDIGPLGELLAPLGPRTYEEAVELFFEQAAALVEGGVDLLYVETMSDLNEARAAIEAARRAAPHLPLSVTFSFDTRGRTSMGLRPEDAARALVDLGVTALGANCGRSLEMTLEAVQRMRQVAPDVPLVAKPNAGMPRLEEGRVVYDATPEMMAGYVQPFLDLGVRVVGGCCGSTPAHISAIADAVRRMSQTGG